MVFNTISNRKLRKSSPESKNHSRRIQARFLFKFKRHWTCFPVHSRMFILIFLLPRFHFSRFINLRPNALRLFLLTHPANLNTCSAHKSIAQREFNNRCFFYSSGFFCRTRFVMWKNKYFVSFQNRTPVQCIVKCTSDIGCGPAPLIVFENCWSLARARAAQVPQHVHRKPRWRRKQIREAQ